ncbi:MAG: hypothetical protein RJQ04_11375 [Longimicrobiales bacterium]
MIRRVSLAAALTLVVAAPLAAQSMDGWQVRVDRSTNAADPDDVPEVTFHDMGAEGIHVATGPAAVVWQGSASATGQYTLSGTFHLEQPSDHNNYYGLVFGGNELNGSSQNYLYFLIGQNGSFIVKHRANDEAVHDIVGRTPHEAIRQPGDDGTSSNDLSVRVGADQIEFMVNGTTVHTQPRAGMASRTDGLFGVRVNHRIPGVRVEGLNVSGGM